MSGLVTRDVETLARALHDVPEHRGWRPTWGTSEHLAQALIDSGAVTPLADAVEALAEDERYGIARPTLVVVASILRDGDDVVRGDA